MIFRLQEKFYGVYLGRTHLSTQSIWDLNTWEEETPAACLLDRTEIAQFLQQPLVLLALMPLWEPFFRATKCKPRNSETHHGVVIHLAKRCLFNLSIYVAWYPQGNFWNDVDLQVSWRQPSFSGWKWRKAIFHVRSDMEQSNWNNQDQDVSGPRKKCEKNQWLHPPEN